ncbi:transcription termination factor mterf15, mitochondrial [Fagus crenata]
MFGFLCSKRLPLLKTRTIQLGFLHQNDFFTVKSFSSLKLSDSTQQKEHSFTVSYLINSCGLSPQSAILALQRVHFENPEKPDSVLNLLKENGFTKTHISKLVRLCPQLLVSDIEKTLLPKIEFFRSKGASSSDLPMILSSNPLLLARSLNNYIIPSYDFLKSLLLVDHKVLTTFKRSSLVDIANNMVPNISLLRQLGVPHSVICSFVMNNPRIAFNKHTRFVEAVNKVKEMGFDPLKTAFVIAIHVVSIIKQPIPESKLELYKRWGWSKDIALLAFKRQPHCMLLSEEKITKAMDFFVNKMGCSGADIARYPLVLSFSLEKRIIPRCSVFQILLAKGLLKNDLSPSTFLKYSERYFLEKFVIKFQDDIPQLLDVYRGKTNLLEIGS